MGSVAFPVITFLTLALVENALARAETETASVRTRQIFFIMFVGFVGVCLCGWGCAEGVGVNRGNLKQWDLSRKAPLQLFWRFLARLIGYRDWNFTTTRELVLVPRFFTRSSRRSTYNSSRTNCKSIIMCTQKSKYLNTYVGKKTNQRWKSWAYNEYGSYVLVPVTSSRTCNNHSLRNIRKVERSLYKWGYLLVFRVQVQVVRYSAAFCWRSRWGAP